MTQFDMFGLELMPGAPLSPAPAVEIECAPIMLRVVPELDAWTRETQRIHLIAHARDLTRLRAAGDTHRVHCILMNAPYVLLKLNGVGGQW
ncbi:hypothetical protein [Caballeronia sordidicola]|uniref:Uncharacterized protein n=1 Tax=Caballeronia sordidicola TaxID=196367 RepID=A0A242N759_CABSO|nr:hypothetical protein [Caballeronia sordidicola]OTP79433.1 hypothetical protein PAMC26577_00800 [Caballeronia sordidicola]